MKEAVDRILKVEQDARQKIERIRQESQELARKAQQKAAELIDLAVSDALAVAQLRKDEADKEFVGEKEKELKLILDKISLKRIEKEKDIPVVSQRIFFGIIQM